MSNFIACDCENLSLPEIGATKCGESFGQVQCFAFSDLDNSPVISSGSGMVGSGSLFDVSSITEKANWQACLVAPSTGGNAPVQMSPVLYNPEFTPGDARTWGGGNSTPDGVEVQLGNNPTTATFELRKVKQGVVANMRQLICLAEAGRLGVHMFNGSGQVCGVDGMVSSGSTGSETQGLLPFKVASISVTDKKFGGLEEPDYNTLTISLAPGWSDKLAIVDLTDQWNGVELI